MDISAVSRATGVPASTLRFYEDKGLIASTGRHGLKRVFAPDVLERLSLIALGRASGFSLDEIAGMFAPDGRLQVDRVALLSRADEIDATIRKLSGMRDGLRHAADCKAPSHLECPRFQRILRAAAAGAFEPARPKALARKRG